MTAALLTVTAAVAGDYVGSALSSGGDIDADGIDDLWVGAYGRDLTTLATNAGYAALFYGPRTGSTTLASADVSFAGTTRDDELGRAVLAAQDLDGDGVGDLAVSAPGRDDASVSNVGAIYVVFGPPDSTVLDPASADATVLGAVTQDGIGTGLRAADLDDDGFGDLLVLAPDANIATTDDGAVYVFSGASLTGSLSVTDARTTLSGGARSDGFGTAAAVPADVDGDGELDIIIGSPGYSRSGATDCGAVYLYTTVTTGSIATSAAATLITGANAGAGYATALGAGDTDGDGFADLILGTSRADVGGTNTGSVVLVLGEGT